MRTYYVYILASKSRRLYVGVTGDLAQRIAAHRNGEVQSTGRYCINRLVHVETTPDVRAAIAREKEIKGWRRAKKTTLISLANPAWDELVLDWRDSRRSR